MTQSRILAIAAAVIIALVGIVWQWQVYARLRREVVSLRTQTYQLTEVQAENARLVRALSQSEADVKRLRTELAALRVDPAGGTPAAGHAREPERGAPPIPTDTSTPRSVAATVRLAISGGDPDALLKTMVLAPGGRELAERAFARLEPDLRERYGTPERMIAELLCATTPPPGAGEALEADEELLGAGVIDPALSEDPAYRTLRTVAPDANGAMVERRDVYRQTEDGWRWLVSAGEVLRRLTETGLTPPPEAATAAVPDGG